MNVGDADIPRLVTRARRGDAEAFSALIRQCERRALAVAYAAAAGDAALAGDAVQDGFLKAWQKIGDLDEPGRFVPWVCEIVRNTAVDLRRRQRRGAEPAGDVVGGRDPAEGAMLSEQRAQIERALATLDEVSRSVVVLRYYENLPSREIGALVGLSAAAVDMRLSRARQEMRLALRQVMDAATSR